MTMSNAQHSHAGKSRPLAIVTGAARGIGAAIAEKLAARGFDLALTDVRIDGAESSLQRARDLGAKVKLFCSDLAQLDRHEALLAEILQWGGKPVSCLVNNAGVAPEKRGDLLETSIDSFDRVLGVNLRGTFFLTQKIGAHMASTVVDGPRSIVSISSVSAEMATTERPEYCISKAGVGMVTKLFALRLAPLGIGVFEVRPGIIQTPMTEVVAEKYTRLIGEGLVPAARWGRPEDIGNTVASLADGSFAFATGSVINVDGALSIPRL